MKEWFLVLWLLWPDGTMEKGEYGPLPSLASCQTMRGFLLSQSRGAVPVKAYCEEETR